MAFLLRAVRRRSMTVSLPLISRPPLSLSLPLPPPHFPLPLSVHLPSPPPLSPSLALLSRPSHHPISLAVFPPLTLSLPFLSRPTPRLPLPLSFHLLSQPPLSLSLPLLSRLSHHPVSFSIFKPPAIKGCVIPLPSPQLTLVRAKYVSRKAYRRESKVYAGLPIHGTNEHYFHRSQEDAFERGELSPMEIEEHLYDLLLLPDGVYHGELKVWFPLLLKKNIAGYHEVWKEVLREDVPWHVKNYKEFKEGGGAKKGKKNWKKRS